MNPAAIQWHVEGGGSLLACGPLLGRAEADGLGVRFSVLTWQGQPSDAFGVLISAGPGPRPALLEVAERYVRGCDFIAAYAQSPDYPLTPLYYWRAALDESLSAVAIEMILSVQTDLLDSRPEVTVNSLALESRLWHASALDANAFREWHPTDAVRSWDKSASREQLFVFRNEGLQLSYAQMVHPTDFVSAEILHAPGRPLVVASTLFPEHLEKGVIRRGRVCGWFLPANNDLATAVELARRFRDEPPPLTA